MEPTSPEQSQSPEITNEALSQSELEAAYDRLWDLYAKTLNPDDVTKPELKKVVEEMQERTMGQGLPNRTTELEIADANGSHWVAGVSSRSAIGIRSVGARIERTQDDILETIVLSGGFINYNKSRIEFEDGVPTDFIGLEISANSSLSVAKFEELNKGLHAALTGPSPN